jgi:tetratricopeptide (TPR) repeat protein
MKQEKSDEAIELLKKEISEQETEQGKNVAIEKASSIIADVSPEKAMNFLNGYEKVSATNINITCFKAKYYMAKGEFDKAEKIVKKILEQLSSISDNDIVNAENVMYSFISYLYANKKIKEVLIFYDLVARKHPNIRMDPGMQLLWARIAVEEKNGIEALKKVDWIIDTFPDYCKQNEHMILITKAMCFDSIGDKKESKRVLNQLEQIIKQNPKYNGVKGMVDDKLKEYRQDEESRKRMAATAKEAIDNPFGFKDGDMGERKHWTVF